jgi:hypothetical protein
VYELGYGLDDWGLITGGEAIFPSPQQLDWLCIPSSGF